MELALFPRSIQILIDDYLYETQESLWRFCQSIFPAPFLPFFHDDFLSPKQVRSKWVLLSGHYITHSDLIWLKVQKNRQRLQPYQSFYYPDLFALLSTICLHEEQIIGISRSKYILPFSTTE